MVHTLPQRLGALSVGALLSLGAESLTSAQPLTTIFSFPFGGAYGGQPQGLIQARDGNFYGTTQLGGQAGCGTVFGMNPQGQFLWSVSFHGNDGAEPQCQLTEANDGHLYGTAAYGGAYDRGTVFKISRNGKLNWTAHFTGSDPGAIPMGRLVVAGQKTILGTTMFGGAYNAGSIFEVTPNGRIRTCYSFTGQTDGAQPSAGLAMGNDGTMYGTASSGGLGYGTIFSITPEGQFVTLYRFGRRTDNNLSFDGANPKGELLLASDGALYGTAYEGGLYGYGVAFRLTIDRQFRVIYNFSGYNDGAGPLGSLIQASDGNLYGVTQYYGVQPLTHFGFGTIFQLAPHGQLSTLVLFTGPNGAFPKQGLIQASDGNLYGTTAGGAYSPGTIFRLPAPSTIAASSALALP